MSAIDGFTDQQVQALEKAYELLGEHFEGALIVVSAEIPPTIHESAESTRIYYTGGYTRAIGMAEYATYSLLRKNRRPKLVPGEEE